MTNSIIISAANNTSITINAAATDTFRSILSNPQVLSFFDVAYAGNVIDAFSSYETDNNFTVLDELPESFVQGILDTVPADGATLNVNLNGRSAAPAAVPAAAGTVTVPVTGTIQINWNGGMNSCTLTGVQLGTANIGSILQNAYVANRFNTTVAALSACDITVQNGDTVTRVTQQAAQNRPVVDGDILWLQARAADDKGVNC